MSKETVAGFGLTRGGRLPRGTIANMPSTPKNKEHPRERMFVEINI